MAIAGNWLLSPEAERYRLQTLDVHNGRYVIQISLIFGMQTILLIINSRTKFKDQSIKTADVVEPQSCRK